MFIFFSFEHFISCESLSTTFCFEDAASSFLEEEILTAPTPLKYRYPLKWIYSNRQLYNPKALILLQFKIQSSIKWSFYLTSSDRISRKFLDARPSDRSSPRIVLKGQTKQ